MTQGIVAYEAYLAEVQASKIADRTESERRHEKKLARKVAKKPFLERLKKLASRHVLMLFGVRWALSNRK